MKLNTNRLKSAIQATGIHFSIGLLLASILAWLVFSIWYPYPYRTLAGGVELFTIIMVIDLICGPLLTFILFSPSKSKRELLTDLSFVISIQIAALSYGMWTVWQTRPIFVVHEADHLNITSRVSLDKQELAALSVDLQPLFFGGPKMTSLREFTEQEQVAINEEIKRGGRDRSERPYFYSKFDGVKVYKSGFPLNKYLLIHPEKKNIIQSIVGSTDATNIEKFKYVPIVGRIYWLAIYDANGQCMGFIEP
jgi:hypothetical protein